MTNYLLSVSIGPVQDFIAAARRTADLFAGSDLLQRVVAAAAETLNASDADLSAHLGRVFPAVPDRGAANKILTFSSNPQDAVDRMAKAARDALLVSWEAAVAAIPMDQRAWIDLERARSQVETFLEVNAAWGPVTPDTYASARMSVERLLAGRKALRDFPPQPADDAGIMNSPLDPSRPSVVTAPYAYAAPAALRRHPLWLKPSEVLDGMSILKRMHGRTLGVVPSTRDLAQRAREPGCLEDDDDDRIPEYPYFAIIVADGDRLGAMLHNHPSVAEHREISASLVDFGDAARVYVEAADGFCVYAGGDDVLALVPVPQLLDCTRALAESFAEVTSATLSVGAAIAHYREPLSLGLERARAAERLAKVDRNSLAVALHTRGGAPLRISERWPVSTLTTWLEHSRQGRLGRGLPYQLRDLAAAWPDTAGAVALRAEVRRVMRHTDPPVPETALEEVPPIHVANDLRTFADGLVLTRFLAGEAS